MPPCQGGCREFEPRLPLHKEESEFQALFYLSDFNKNSKMFTIFYIKNTLYFFRGEAINLLGEAHQGILELLLLSLCSKAKASRRNLSPIKSTEWSFISGIK